jgi:hypothetical protein
MSSRRHNAAMLVSTRSPSGRMRTYSFRRVPVARHSADLPNGGFSALVLLGHFASRFAVQGAGSVTTQIKLDFPLGVTT